MSPRPVYVEELKMLGFYAVIELPAQNVPVCWAINDRYYYYYGKLIVVAQKGNIYDEPLVVFEKDLPFTELKPIDLRVLVEKNSDAIRSAENEAMDFIKEKFYGVAGCVS